MRCSLVRGSAPPGDPPSTSSQASSLRGRWVQRRLTTASDAEIASHPPLCRLWGYQKSSFPPLHIHPCLEGPMTRCSCPVSGAVSSTGSTDLIHAHTPPARCEPTPAPSRLQISKAASERFPDLQQRMIDRPARGSLCRSNVDSGKSKAPAMRCEAYSAGSLTSTMTISPLSSADLTASGLSAGVSAAGLMQP